MFVCTYPFSGVLTCNGLCEALMSGNDMRCQPEVPAMMDVQDLSILSFDSSPLPEYPEKVSDVHKRYFETFKQLANKYWPDNILLVTHEICVRDSVQWGGCNDEVEATYCGQVELVRTEQQCHDKWALVEYHGVYKYETMI